MSKQISPGILVIPHVTTRGCMLQSAIQTVLGLISEGAATSLRGTIHHQSIKPSCCVSVAPPDTQYWYYSQSDSNDRVILVLIHKSFKVTSLTLGG